MNEFHRSEEHTTEVDPFLTSGFSKLTLGNTAKPTEWRSQSLFGPIGSDPTQSSGTKPKSSEETNLFQRSYTDTRTKIDTSPFTTGLNRHQQVEENQVDSWIDLLDATKPPPLQSQPGGGGGGGGTRSRNYRTCGPKFGFQNRTLTVQ